MHQEQSYADRWLSRSSSSCCQTGCYTFCEDDQRSVLYAKQRSSTVVVQTRSTQTRMFSERARFVRCTKALPHLTHSRDTDSVGPACLLRGPSHKTAAGRPAQDLIRGRLWTRAACMLPAALESKRAIPAISTGRDRDVLLLLRGQDQHSAAVSGQKLALALAPGSLSLINNVDRPTVG